MEQRGQIVTRDRVKTTGPQNMEEIRNRLSSLENGHKQMSTKLDHVEKRLTTLEGMGESVDEILQVVTKLARYIKAGLPAVVSAAVAAGVVNGKIGAFLGALFH